MSQIDIVEPSWKLLQQRQIPRLLNIRAHQYVLLTLMLKLLLKFTVESPSVFENSATNKA